MLDELKQSMSEGMVEDAKQQVWIILIWSILIVEIMSTCSGCSPLGLCEDGEGGGVGRWGGEEGELCEEEFGQDHH